MNASPNLLPGDGEAYLYPGFFEADRADRFLGALTDELPWSNEEAHLFGRRLPLPRLTSWHGPVAYAYSGVVHSARPFTPQLEIVRDAIASIAGLHDCVLANLYRDGNDSMSWHADEEPIWGINPTIASVSFGATRRFQLKHNSTGERVTVDLANGDVLVMCGPTQHYWRHAITKTKTSVKPRINLTYRTTLRDHEAAGASR